MGHSDVLAQPSTMSSPGTHVFVSGSQTSPSTRPTRAIRSGCSASRAPTRATSIRTTSSTRIPARSRARVRTARVSSRAAATVRAADRLVAAGVTSILNFAPVVLSVPEGVDVRKVDLSIELQILAYHEQRKANGAEAAVPAGAAEGGVA